MSRLHSLQCTSCGLSGQLPAWQGLPSLRQLLLQHNAFSGGLPVSFAWLPSLDTIDLSYNQLSVVPGGEYFSLHAKALKVLILRGNSLNGTLPGGKEWRRCLAGDQPHGISFASLSPAILIAWCSRECHLVRGAAPASAGGKLRSLCDVLCSAKPGGRSATSAAMQVSQTCFCGSCLQPGAPATCSSWTWHRTDWVARCLLAGLIPQRRTCSCSTSTSQKTCSLAASLQVHHLSCI
jgi:hypothetical protein